MEVILSKVYKFTACNPHVETDTLTFNEPTSKTAKFFAPIKQMFQTAFAEYLQNRPKEVEAANKEEVKEEELKESAEQIKGEYIIMILNNSTKVDMGEFYEKVKLFFCTTGICTFPCPGMPVNVNLQFTDLDKISFEDFELMVGEYIKSFLLLSKLKG
jgi:hypothetical protein